MPLAACNRESEEEKQSKSQSLFKEDGEKGWDFVVRMMVIHKGKRENAERSRHRFMLKDIPDKQEKDE